MSPEYSVGLDSRQRCEIITTPTLGDTDKDFKRASLIGNVATSFLKRKELNKAIGKLQEILPPQHSRYLAIAAMDCMVGANVKFQVNPNGETQVNEVNIPGYGES